MSKKKKKQKWPSALIILICLIVIYTVSSLTDEDKAGQETDTTGTSVIETLSETLPQETETYVAETTTSSFDIGSIPAYSGKPYVAVNKNEPQFGDYEKGLKKGYEYYAPLDRLGRCGVTIALIGRETMPTKEREPIGMVKPTGWHTVKYDFVDGYYLYNRCHLIGYQMSAENANVRNLITGTRYMNVQGMLPFENMVADYVRETNNHVIYRVTPIFEGNNLLASGVQMEAYSLEDNGKGVSFNVFCYNVQPGVTIDYTNGNSSIE